MDFSSSVLFRFVFEKKRGFGSVKKKLSVLFGFLCRPVVNTDKRVSCLHFRPINLNSHNTL